MDFYQIMTLIAVSAFVVLVIYAARALAQIKKTAESVEYLSVLAAENVEKTQSAFELLNNVTSLLDSTFYKAMKLGVDLLSRCRSHKDK